jgi:hypothetical protein
MKGQNKMGRRGPKAKQGAREPNGRLSRKPADVTTQLNGNLEAEEREALRIGVEARQRLYSKPYGIQPGQLRDTDAGSFVGRLRIAGHISMQQCEAAIRFAEVHHGMTLAISGPKPSGALNPNASHGMPGAENVARSVKALADWRSMLNAIQARQNKLRGQGALYAALDICITRDADARTSSAGSALRSIRWRSIFASVTSIGGPLDVSGKHS